MDSAELARQIAASLEPVLAAEEFDIIPDPAGGVDLATDTWSLHIEETIAFLAIDDEPEHPSEFPAVLAALFGGSVTNAIATADRSLDGALTTLLTASGDPLSLAFASSLVTATD